MAPSNSPVPAPAPAYQAGARVEGLLLATFGPDPKGKPSHLMLVNLDYKTPQTCHLRTPSPVEAFEPATRHWQSHPGLLTELPLGGMLLRLVP